VADAEAQRLRASTQRSRDSLHTSSLQGSVRTSAASESGPSERLVKWLSSTTAPFRPCVSFAFPGWKTRFDLPAPPLKVADSLGTEMAVEVSRGEASTTSTVANLALETHAPRLSECGSPSGPCVACAAIPRALAFAPGGLGGARPCVVRRSPGARGRCGPMDLGLPCTCT
jgi:hypothetical protein